MHHQLDTTPLHNFLSQCFNVIELVCELDSLELLAHLGGDLRTLRVATWGSGSRGTGLAKVAELFGSHGPRGLRTLGKLVVQDTIIRAVYTRGVRRELLVAACNRNGVQLIWGEDA